MTRIFIYLLALLTGFSGAEAARPMSAAPAELSAIALAAADAVLTAPSTQNLPVTSIPALADSTAAPYPAIDFALLTATVARGDRARI